MFNLRLVAHEVVRKSDQMNFGSLSLFAWKRLEVVLETTFEAVERQVHQSGGNHAALWRAFLCRVEDVPVDEASFQPLLEDASFDWDVGHQPVMADSVERSHNLLPHSRTQQHR